MRTFVLGLIGTAAMLVSVNAYSAVLDLTPGGVVNDASVACGNDDGYFGSIRLRDYVNPALEDGGVAGPYNTLFAAREYFSGGTYLELEEYKGFAEFNLAQLIPIASRISSIDILFGAASNSGLGLNILAMNDREDGSIRRDAHYGYDAELRADYDASATLLANLGNPNAPCSLSVTSSVLDDILAGNSYSGFVFAVQPGPDPIVTYDDRFQGAYFLSNLRMSVTYDDSPIAQPVPEPASMILMGSGLLGLIGVGRKKLIRK